MRLWPTFMQNRYFVIIVMLLSIIIILLLFLSTSEFQNIQKFMPEIVSNYEINTVCDLGTTPEKIMMEKLFPVMFEVAAGKYNNNEDLIEYVSTLEVNGHTYTTAELFPVQESTPEGQVLGNSYDPAHFDMFAMMPYILVVMDASPEIIETFTLNPQKDTHASYNLRILTEIEKCQ